MEGAVRREPCAGSETWPGAKRLSKVKAVEMLSENDDFKDQSSWIERIFNHASESACGHQMLFAPKCHPELQ